MCRHVQSDQNDTATVEEMQMEGLSQEVLALVVSNMDSFSDLASMCRTSAWTSHAASQRLVLMLVWMDARAPCEDILSYNLEYHTIIHATFSNHCALHSRVIGVFIERASRLSRDSDGRDDGINALALVVAVHRVDKYFLFPRLVHMFGDVRTCTPLNLNTSTHGIRQRYAW